MQGKAKKLPRVWKACLRLMPLNSRRLFSFPNVRGSRVQLLRERDYLVKNKIQTASTKFESSLNPVFILWSVYNPCATSNKASAGTQDCGILFLEMSCQEEAWEWTVCQGFYLLERSNCNCMALVAVEILFGIPEALLTAVLQQPFRNVLSVHQDCLWGVAVLQTLHLF